MAELKQALLGRLAGGVDGVNAAAPTTGAAQDIDAEGVLMKGTQSSLRVVRAFFFASFDGDGGAGGGGIVTLGRKAACGA